MLQAPCQALVRPVSTTQCAGRARRSAGLQAEYVQGSEDLRQLLVGAVATMAVSFPTLKEDIINSPMPTTTVSQGQDMHGQRHTGPKSPVPSRQNMSPLLNIGWRPIVKAWRGETRCWRVRRAMAIGSAVTRVGWPTGRSGRELPWRGE